MIQSASTPETAEVVECPTRERFREILRRNRPVKIVGAVSDWKALQDWTLAGLKEQIGHYDTSVMDSPSGTYESRSASNFKLADYIDRVLSPSDDRRQLYAAGLVAERFEELRGDYRQPDFLPSPVPMRLFLGKDTRTGGHFHRYKEAVQTQICGSKTLHLYPPSQLRDLYLRGVLSDYSNFCGIDFHDPDYARHPRFRNTCPIEVTIHAGEQVFIPIHWLHVVFGHGENISGTFFWKTDIRYWTWPVPGWRCLLYKPFNWSWRLQRMLPRSVRAS